VCLRCDLLGIVVCVCVCVCLGRVQTPEPALHQAEGEDEIPWLHPCFCLCLFASPRGNLYEHKDQFKKGKAHRSQHLLNLE
jgi:hypothetical protein